jgi:hypothetical protein
MNIVIENPTDPWSPVYPVEHSYSVASHPSQEMHATGLRIEPRHSQELCWPTWTLVALMSEHVQ